MNPDRYSSAINEAKPSGLRHREWLAVAERDEWSCMAPKLDPEADACRGPFYAKTPAIGTIAYLDILTFDHVKENAGGSRIHDRQHGVLLCHHHNVDGWASGHRDLERDHLARHYPDIWGRGR